MGASETKMTEAGRKLVLSYLDKLTNNPNQLATFVRWNGDEQTTFRALRLSAGDGAAKAAAQKLARDGYGEFRWDAWRKVRLFLPNACALARARGEE